MVMTQIFVELKFSPTVSELDVSLGGGVSRKFSFQVMLRISIADNFY